MSIANCSLICRQLEDVDRELEVHRKTERVLHEKVSFSFSCYYSVN